VQRAGVVAFTSRGLQHPADRSSSCFVRRAGADLKFSWDVAVTPLVAVWFTYLIFVTFLLTTTVL